VYRVWQSKVTPPSFSLFSKQPFGILIYNFTDFFLKCSMANCQEKFDSVEKW